MNRNYRIQLIQNGQLLEEAYADGNSGMEALENAVEQGALRLPNNQEVTVIAMNNYGLAVKFEANQL